MPDCRKMLSIHLGRISLEILTLTAATGLGWSIASVRPESVARPKIGKARQKALGDLP
jgi:hypothetical protein